MVEEPSHVNQLSLNHMCEIGLIKILYTTLFSCTLQQFGPGSTFTDYILPYITFRNNMFCLLVEI
jgi:hypothetical protein